MENLSNDLIKEAFRLSLALVNLTEYVTRNTELLQERLNWLDALNEISVRQ